MSTIFIDINPAPERVNADYYMTKIREVDESVDTKIAGLTWETYDSEENLVFPFGTFNPKATLKIDNVNKIATITGFTDVVSNTAGAPKIFCQFIGVSLTPKYGKDGSDFSERGYAFNGAPTNAVISPQKLDRTPLAVRNETGDILVGASADLLYETSDSASLGRYYYSFQIQLA
jgi:hypothetical protein